jgi:hypothetical protein
VEVAASAQTAARVRGAAMEEVPVENHHLMNVSRSRYGTIMGHHSASRPSDLASLRRDELLLRRQAGRRHRAPQLAPRHDPRGADSLREVWPRAARPSCMFRHGRPLCFLIRKFLVIHNHA